MQFLISEEMKRFSPFYQSSFQKSSKMCPDFFHWSIRCGFLSCRKLLHTIENWCSAWAEGLSLYNHLKLLRRLPQRPKVSQFQSQWWLSFLFHALWCSGDLLLRAWSSNCSRFERNALVWLHIPTHTQIHLISRCSSHSASGGYYNALSFLTMAYKPDFKDDFGLLCDIFLALAVVCGVVVTQLHVVYVPYLTDYEEFGWAQTFTDILIRQEGSFPASL